MACSSLRLCLTVRTLHTTGIGHFTWWGTSTWPRSCEGDMSSVYKDLSSVTSLSPAGDTAAAISGSSTSGSWKKMNGEFVVIKQYASVHGRTYLDDFSRILILGWKNRSCRILKHSKCSNSPKWWYLRPNIPQWYIMSANHLGDMVDKMFEQWQTKNISDKKFAFPSNDLKIVIWYHGGIPPKMEDNIPRSTGEA